MSPLLKSGLCVLLVSFLSEYAMAEVTVTKMDDRVRVQIDGALFTEYRYTGAPHVYFHPLIGPGGVEMTRNWPMRDVAGEEHDHPHHRSLWFAHGAVNGIDFWAEPESFSGGAATHPLGKIVHDDFVTLRGGAEEGVIVDRLKWVGPDGTIPLTALQTMRVFQRPASERMFDFDVALTAGDKDVVMGDTKEGSMALRIAESMRLKLAKNQPGEGHMVDSVGDRDGAVWGKRADWVDYSGPVKGKVVGIAFFDHPSNPRHPTRWHARDYGLFAANPFCEHDMDHEKPAGAGDLRIPAGETATFRYRVLLHEGDDQAAKVAERFAEYAKQTSK